MKMKAWRRVLGTLAVGSLAAGCSGGPSAPGETNKVVAAEQPANPATQKPATPAVMPRTPETGPPLPPLAYQPKGRRDPFAPVVVAKEKKTAGLEVGTVKLVGIIRGSQRLALVEAPDGLGYILKPGDALGNGRVTDVSADSVTFAITGSADQRDTNLTLRLVKD